MSKPGHLQNSEFDCTSLRCWTNNMLFGFRAIVCVFIAYLAYKYLYEIKRPAPITPIVRVKHGDLQGIVSKSRGGRDYYEYLGIPYARPPVGDLRYESPEPPALWAGVRDASTYKEACIQNPAYLGPLTGVEDCLYLNVFAPVAPENEGKPLNVMVWIHGGHFIEGFPEMYQPQYFMDEDVIIVTIQYRLNSFGFLDTGDEVVRGNMGLKDQTFALKWVEENIANFGGDSKKVTIFGESAGAASVHFHMLSPMSKGLFQKAISQSGQATGTWAMQRKPAVRAKRLATQVNCPTEITRDMIKCMKKVPVLKIAQTHTDMKDPLKDQHTLYLPTVEAVDDEHAFLAKEPQQIIDEGKDGVGTPWLTGVNSEDGLILWNLVQRIPEAKARMCDPEYWSFKMMDVLCLNVNANNSDRIANSIRSHYFGTDGDICDVDKFRKQYNSLLSHPNFFNPFYNAARSHAKHSPTYTYYYSHIGEISVVDYMMGMVGKYPVAVEFMYVSFKQWVATLMGYESTYTGAAHGDELRYLFNTGMSLAADQLEFSKELVKTWVQFAKNEKSASFMNVKLVPVNPKENTLKCLEINQKPKYITFPHENDVHFWNGLKF